MNLGTSHTHSHGHRDGDTLQLEETVEAAIENRLSFIGITDHYPLPPGLRKYNLILFSDHYFDEFFRVKDKYSDQIEILIGAEVGWAENIKDWTAQDLKKRDYDYLIASVHGVCKDGFYYSIDWDIEKYQENLEIVGGIQNIIKEYYGQMRDAISSGLFNIVGHMDLIKLQNKNLPLFSPEEPWYLREVSDTLNLIKEKQMCIEINSHGWHKPCKEQFPSIEILTEARKRDIPITLGSDGHYPHQVGLDLHRASELVKCLGYDHIVYFKNRKMIGLEI